MDGGSHRGKLIRKYRNNAGLSRVEQARILGCSEKTLQRWEKDGPTDHAADRIVIRMQIEPQEWDLATRRDNRIPAPTMLSTRIPDTISLQTGDDYFLPDHIHARMYPDKRFLLAFPPRVLDEIQELEEKLNLPTSARVAVAYKDEIFGMPGGVRELSEELGIPKLEDLIERCRLQNALELQRKWRKMAAKAAAEPALDEIGINYNTLKPGVYEMQLGLRSTPKESPFLNLQLYQTDFFTSRTMTRCWKLLRADNHSITTNLDATRILSEFERYRYFTASLGVNFVLECADGTIYMVERGIDQSEPKNVHISMNEGVDNSDLIAANGDYDIVHTAKRGFRDEVFGRKFEDSVSRLYFRDLFFTSDLGQIGLTGYAKTDLTFEKAELLPAKDKVFETSKRFPIRASAESIRTLIQERRQDFQPHGMYTLQSIAQIEYGLK